ncbi:unnamed protein product [Heligmosomoides polygyrus]|uniref:Cytochrome P450 n=1 Tax=Heligmosomoides polygyrus TaxID=6339 RepID=A0A183FHK7_HELPZ|nr:unnamed protein product [Heligmosomoides polygyrus]
MWYVVDKTLNTEPHLRNLLPVLINATTRKLRHGVQGSIPEAENQQDRFAVQEQRPAIDPKEAFHSVGSEAVTLVRHGVPSQYIKLLPELYNGFTTAISVFCNDIVVNVDWANAYHIPEAL